MEARFSQIQSQLEFISCADKDSFRKSSHILFFKCQLFCTREHSMYGKRGGKACESLLEPVNKDGYDAMEDKIKICLE